LEVAVEDGVGLTPVVFSLIVDEVDDLLPMGILVITPGDTDTRTSLQLQFMSMKFEGRSTFKL
jgi:hypothetical protein